MSLPFSEDSVIDAEPISYSLPHHYSSSNTTLSLFPQVSENLAASKPITTTVDFSSIDGGKDHPNSPFLTLFTRVYENSKPIAKNTPQPSLPNTSSTAQSSIDSQYCFVFGSSSREVNALGNWITKKLTRSDVNGASRLLLSRQDLLSLAVVGSRVQNFAVCDAADKLGNMNIGSGRGPTMQPVVKPMKAGVPYFVLVF
ncbi:hypothetical protein KY289_033800 [Solanum tuberosum]|nr:hypothetical protein KY289_033800 [Solanum tuberosum]